MQAYAIIANTVIVSCFHSTDSLSAWYEKRIKIFLSTWNQIRVSLATTGKPTATYSGKNTSVNLLKKTGLLH